MTSACQNRYTDVMHESRLIPLMKDDISWPRSGSWKSRPGMQEKRFLMLKFGTILHERQMCGRIKKRSQCECTGKMKVELTS